MTDFLFYFSAASVLPFWAAMILFPNSIKTEKLVGTNWIILPPVVCYLGLLLPNLPDALLIFTQPSPENLAVMMGLPWAAALFWAYAGAFDLFVGRWIFYNGREHKISHVLLAPLLFICILFGPLAFFLFALIRGWQAKSA